MSYTHKKPTLAVLTVTDLFKRSTREPGSGCWNWGGGTTGNGSVSIYTLDYTRGEKRSMSACSAVWNITHGKGVPEGVTLYRCCANRRCVNPDHVMPAKSLSEARYAYLARVSRRPPSITAKFMASIQRNLGVSLIPDDVALKVLAMPGTCTEVSKA